MSTHLALLNELQKLTFLRKRYEKQLEEVGFQIDKIDSKLNEKLDKVAKFQKISHLHDMHSMYMEMLYYEKMRNHIDTKLTIAAFKREVEKHENSIENAHLDCCSLEMIIEDSQAKSIETRRELEDSRKELEKLDNLAESNVDQKCFDVEKLVEKTEKFLSAHNL